MRIGLFRGIGAYPLAARTSVIVYVNQKLQEMALHES
jgi:hypothetical protein